MAAIVYCDKIIENYPDNPYWVEALYLKGIALSDRARYEEAMEQFKRILEYPGDHRLKRDAEARIREMQP
jgi:tetratricopeptide (TPR) repeat protein